VTYPLPESLAAGAVSELATVMDSEVVVRFDDESLDSFREGHA